MSIPAVRIADLFAHHASHLGTTVTVQGWVRTRRDSKAGISFVAITDGSGSIDVRDVSREVTIHESGSGSVALQRVNTVTQVAAE